MTGPLYKLGGIAARRPLPVIALWLVLTVATVIGANSVGRPTNDNLDIPGADSTRATDILAADLPKQANGSVPIVLQADEGKLTEGENRTAVQDTVKAYKRNRYVNEAISPLSQEGADDVTDDGTLGFIALFLNLSAGDLDVEEAEELLALADPAQRAGIDVSAGGYLGQELSNPSTDSSEAIGLAAAIVVLLIAFGAAAAVPLPITTAIMALLTGLALVGFLGNAIQVPSIAPTLGTMLGLAVGIDYSLFIISRHQVQLREGMDPHESAARSIATSGSAVVFAGTTVVIALVCLYFSGIKLVAALGFSAAVVVAVAILAAVTLLPALLGLLGRRVEAWKVPFLSGQTRGEDPANIWRRWSEFLGRRPLLVAPLAIALLAVVAIPMLQMSLGSPDFGQYPKDTTERQAYDQLASGFGVGTNGPLLVAVEFPADDPAHNDQTKLNEFEAQEEQQQEEATAQANAIAQELVAEGVPPDEAQQQAEAEVAPSQSQQQEAQQQEQFLESTASDPRLVELENKVKKTAGVKEVTPATVDGSGSAAVFSAVPKSGPSSEKTRELVDLLRAQVIPDATRGNGLEAFIGGETASYVDLATAIGDKLPLVIAIVVALSFVLIALAFRSLLVPAIGALLNLLAVAAAYGVLTAVFELGWGVEIIGLEGEQPVVSYVPLMMFAILFGLSMDYQVFLLTRVKEVWDKRGDAREAAIDGLARASRVIVSAATIMVAVFASFVINANPVVKQFGVGLAAAVAIDAFVVIVLMPALLLFLGSAAWWLPRWLDRSLPDVGVEGEGYFEELDSRTEP